MSEGESAATPGLVHDEAARSRAEQELARSERFARSVVEASADCVKGLSPDGRILWINENGRRSLELREAEEFRGRDWRSLWDLGGFRAEVEAALVAARAGRVGQFRGYCPTAGGQPRWWDVSVTAIFGPDRQIEQLLCVSRDVTEARRTEEALRESEGRLQVAREAARLGLIDIDLVAGTVLWDDRVRELWGVGAGAVVAYETFIAGLHPEDRAVTAAAVERALDPAGNGDYAAEYRVVSQGRIRWVCAAGRVFFRGGQAVRLVGTVQDISARKAAERRLALEHEVSRLLLHAAALDEVVPAVLRAVLDGVDADFCALWLADESGQALRCTNTLARGDEAPLRAFAAASREQDPGIDLAGRAWRSGRPDWVEGLEAEAAGACGLASGAATPLGGNPCLGAIEWFSRATRSRDEEVLATVAAVGAELGQFLLRRQAELAREASEGRLRLALEATAVGTWEWNLATNQVRWDAQMFRLYGLEPTPGGIVQYEDWSGAVLPEDLAEQEKDLAETVHRRRSGRRAFRVRRRDSGECRHIESVEMVRLNEQGEAQWVGDPLRLTQIFSNLLTNAAKYTEREGRITVSARREGETVAVSIRDTGIGIPPDMLTGVFGMFNQVDRTLEKTTGGLGIGLSLARGLVLLHGGSIEAASEGEGRGSEFTVRLPVLSAELAGGLTRAEAGAATSRSRRLSILVVDDNRDAAESMATVLEMFGHSVRAVFDGEAGAREAGTLRPEVAFLDIGMPKLNGYDVCRRIRAEEWGREMVLVALTGWGADDDRKRTRAVGFDYHLTKPVNPDALQDLLDNLGERPKSARS